LDPFHIQPGWFVLDFSNCHVKPNREVPQPIRTQVENTIRILRLNSDDSLVQFRFSLVRNYSKNHIDMHFLNTCYPFMAIELVRQGLDQSIKGTIP
jgi:hypothetical protein